MTTSAIIKAGDELVNQLNWHGPREINEAADHMKAKSNDFNINAWERKQYAKLAKLMKGVL